jgi:hypothetical protein
MQRIDREIAKIQRLINEKTNQPALPAYTSRSTPSVKENGNQYRPNTNRDHFTVFKVSKEAPLFTERTA